MDIIPKKENKNFKAENNKNALLEGGSGNTPLISVIVPVYNSEKYIEKCIKSIQNQIYKNLQIIIIDDGSSDLSGKKCDDFAENDSRILVIHKQNEGQAKARTLDWIMLKENILVLLIPMIIFFPICIQVYIH